MQPVRTVALMIAFLIGALIVVVFTPRFLKSFTVRHWKKVRGRVTETWISRSQTDASNSVYMPQIRYSYSYADREYRGERIGVAQGLASDYRSEAQELIAKYAPGTEVEVYVNPKKPSDAQLEMGVAWSLLVGVLLGIFFMVFAVAMLIGSD